MGLLENVSEAEIRALGIDALRRWRQREIAATRQPRDPIERHTGAVFSLHGDLGLELVKLLAEQKDVRNVDANRLKEAFQEDAAMFRAWMNPVAEFIWWLVRAGLAVEHTYGNKSPDPSRFHARVFPSSMRMTARGVRFLDGSDDDPLLPGFLDRIKLRCPGLPDGVVALLSDARECVDRCLLRPAVILMGVAYELTIEVAISDLVNKGLLNKSTLELEAGRRLKRLRELLAREDIKQLLPERDDRRRADAACDFADQLRLSRNDAAHTRPAYDYEHAGETEEFLVSAGRHLPGLWLLAHQSQ